MVKCMPCNPHPHCFPSWTLGRYGKGHSTRAGFRSNFFLTTNAVITLIRRYGIVNVLKGNINLQADIANNRRAREKKEIKLDDGF